MRNFHFKYYSLLLKGISLFMLILFPYKGNGQENARLLENAREYFLSGDYYNASVIYGELINLGYKDLEIQWNFAESNRLFNNYDEAIQAYLQLMKADVNLKYPLARFYLAEMYRNRGIYSQAKSKYQEYLLINKKKDDFFYKKALQSIASCEFALKNDSLNSDIEILHLGKQINTPYSEFGAWSLGDSVLYFSALRKMTEDNLTDLLPGIYLSKIYRSKISVSGYKQTQLIDKRINHEEIHSANFTYDYKNEVAYFTRCDDQEGEMKCQIYKSKFANGKWSKATRLNNKINLEGYTSTQPWITHDSLNEILYFVSDRPGGLGNLDIWYSILINGEPQIPINLGFPVNTPGNEITPFYHIPSKTLYFSSDWHDGYGGYDIQKSVGERNFWQKPENAGKPINSSANDLYFFLNDESTTAYITSNRPGSYFIKGETCCNDIFELRLKKSFKKQDSVIYQIDDSIRSLLPLSLFFHNDEPDPGSVSNSTSKTYLETLQEYSKLQQKYEVNYTSGLKGIDSADAVADIQAFFNDSVREGFRKLEQIKDYLFEKLQRGESVELTLKGYASPLNSSQYNEILSKRRIQSFINYLITVDSGKFVPYINGEALNNAQLIIDELPLGESESSLYVSDNPNDQRNSIYSIAAARERRIEILHYRSVSTESIISNSPDMLEISYDPYSLELGEIKSGETKAFIFRFKNESDDFLEVDSLILDNNIRANCNKSKYQAGEHGYIQMFLSADSVTGLKESKIILQIKRNNRGIILLFRYIVI